MAVLTDILIAPANDAPAIISQWPGSKKWPAFQTTGLDWLLLSELAGALDQAQLATSIEELDASSFADEANGPWVYVLPMDFRDHIASIAADEVGTVASAWSTGEEATERGLTAQDAQRLLLEIRTLAVQARDEQKPMLLWVSL